jgi:hypothetical protein
VTGQWRPANEVETALRDAWLRDDDVLFLRTIAAAPLYLPGFTSSPRLLTWQRDGRAYLLAFTSPEALYQQLTGVVDGWRLTDMTSLIAGRPDPELGIVVNPNAPIGAYLNPDELEVMAGLLADDPIFCPGSPAEAVMFRAQRDARPASYLDALVASAVLVPLTAEAAPEDLQHDGFPWRIERVGDGPALSVFTSGLRLAEAVSDTTPTVRLDFRTLAAAWPDPAWQLAVNPRSAIAATFASPQIAHLVAWSDRRVPAQRNVADLLRGRAPTH